jgi:Protein of unknown function (DUF1353)
MWRPLVFFIAFTLVISNLSASRQQNSKIPVHLPIYGKFTGTLKLSPIGDGVHMTVLETISYDDGINHELNVPAGFEIDGASIPRALWSIVGSPF